MANWIKKATSKHKGAFKASAKRAGMTTSSYARKNASKGGTLGRRARLALTLMRMKKK